MRRLELRLALAMAAVAVITAIGSLPTAILYFERRIAGLPPAISALVERQVMRNVPADFDGLAELAVGAGISALLGSTLGYLMARRIARPVQAVSRAARRVAAGDLSARADASAGGYRRRHDEAQRLRQDFDAMADTLQRLDVERRTTAAAIAHELRTPLTILQGRLEAARDEVLPLDDAALGLLVQQTTLLGRLVDDLKILSLADAGQLSLDPAASDLGALVEEVIAGLRQTADRRGITLEVEAQPGPPVTIDADRIRQVLGNLLDNALRHTPPGGVVSVELTHAPDAARLRVVDAGSGIAPHERDRVFERFYRTDAGRASAAGGTGQGLAVVKTLVELHGGAVRVDPGPGGGAAFTVTLPSTPSAHPSAAPQLGQ